MTRNILSRESIFYNIITGIIILFVALFALLTHINGFDIATFIIVMWVAKDIPTGPMLAPAP